MTPGRWRRLEELYDAVVNLTTAERNLRLQDTDAELRSALEAILANKDMERPAWESHASLLQTSTVMTAGTQLGPYRIERQIGAGGMGKVYQATDTRLDRQVAIKISNSPFDERFQREMRVIASLNHPHICTLHDVGADYMVMELVEGETVATRVAKGALPLSEVLRYGAQIAGAIAAAHDRNITHRDLKPANVMLTKNGVKLLDFGLARHSAPDATVTRTGVVVGTPAYMAPEQAQGKQVDKRVDVWAFGVLLYELLTGHRPFPGDSMQETLTAVLTKEPDLSVVPYRVRPLLRACLAKDPQDRLSSIADWGFLLGDDSARVPSTPLPVQWRRWAVAAALVVAGIFSWIRFNAPFAQPSLARFGVPIPGGLARDALLALSPDGSSIAISAFEEGRFRLRVRPLDSLQTRLLPGTDGARVPFWSPDGKQIGFFADGRLKTIPVAGGSPVTLAEVEPLIIGATWGTGRMIVFSQARELYKVNETGGVPERLYKDSGILSDPEFLPDGNHLLWLNSIKGVFLGSLDGKPPVPILPDISRTVYSADGYLIFARQGRLTAQRFDLRTFALTGEALPITPESVINGLSAARSGVLAYTNKGPEQLAWVDRTGSIKEKVGPPQEWRSFRLSADQSKVAYASVAPGRSHGVGGVETNYDVSVFDVRRGTRERLTSEGKNSLVPVFSPDGKHIAFSSNRTGRYNPYITEGPNRETLVVDMQLAGGFPTDWSPDGKNLLYWGNEDLWIVPVDGKEKPYALAKTRFDERAGSFSPDGKWVAYSSNESFQYEVYLTSFPADGKRYTVSNQGGSTPAWRRDGKELYFVAGDGQLTAVPVNIRGSNVQFGPVKSLFPVDSTDFFRTYDPSLDGERFLIAIPSEQGGATFTVMLNWTQALRK